MEENGPKLLKDHVRTQCRDGRRYYDHEVKQTLIRQAAIPGASISALAREHGISASLLRRWVNVHGNEQVMQRPVPMKTETAAFVPVTLSGPGAPPAPRSLTARLPNGVQIEFAQGDGASVASLLELLWRLPCSDSIRS